MTIAVIITLTLFVVLFLLAGVTTKTQLPTWVNDRSQAERLSLQLNPAYREKVEADRQHELATAKLHIEHEKLDFERVQFAWQQWQAHNRVETAQYGTWVPNATAAQLTLLAPVYKPALLKPGDVGAPLAASLPDKYDLRSVWNELLPSYGEIFLGKSAEGNIIVPVNKLLHSVATGPTGGGKTNIVRCLLMQLVYVGCDVTLMDIHYAPIKEDENGNPIDWRPIVNRLESAPIYKLDAIVKYMQWLAFTELEERIANNRNGMAINKMRPIFFTIAELPAVLAEAGSDVGAPLAKILRQGRQYRMYFVGDSQDLLTETLKINSGARECFRTGFYTGGDQTTAKALLDLPKGVTVDETGLGKDGQVYIKRADNPHVLARVAWASNESLYDLYGTPNSQRLTTTRAYHDMAAPADTGSVVEGSGYSRSYSQQPSGGYTNGYTHSQPVKPMELPTQIELNGPQKAKMAAVLRLDAEHKSQNEIIKEVWNVQPNDRAGQEAAKELRLIRSYIAQCMQVPAE